MKTSRIDSEGENLVDWFWRYGILAISGIIIVADIFDILRKLRQGKLIEVKQTSDERAFMPNIVESNNEMDMNVEKFVLIEKSDTSFNDIGGLDDVKEILRMEIIYPRLKRDIFELYDRSPGCGVLLYGPPGCGKTLLAKAVARECGSDVKFITPRISDIMSRWVGESEKIISAVFDYTKKYGEYVIFFDEVDSLIPRAGPSYVRRIKDTFLQCMDGIYTKKENTLILGATNRPWLIDPAMRRPGRFGKVILIPPPDPEARKRIFEIHLRRLISKGMTNEDVDLDELAFLTNGYSGADIQALCQDARDMPLTEAIKGGSLRPVNRDDFTKAINQRKPSIYPWIIEALRSIKRYGAEEFNKPINDLASIYLKEIYHNI